MYYKCRCCNHEETRGCLPTATCGLYFLFLMGLTVAIGIFIVRLLRSDASGQPHDLGWWDLVLFPVAMFAGLILVLIGAMFLNFTFELIEYLAFSLRRCPRCRSRKWSWGYSRGFGL